MTFRFVRSWRVGKTGPAPQVVFEFASEETWHNDLEEKPLKYAQMGVKEYFAYDPNDPPINRLDKSSGQMRELVVYPDGRLWSQHLESYLLPDREYLRLYDGQGVLRLTRAEAEARRAEEEARRAVIEAEARQAAERRAVIEAEARQAAERRAEVLAEKIRALGIDADAL